MSLLHAIRSVWLWLFWTLCVKAGGGRHPSYAYARFEQWRARETLRRFLTD